MESGSPIVLTIAAVVLQYIGTLAEIPCKLASMLVCQTCACLLAKRSDNEVKVSFMNEDATMSILWYLSAKELPSLCTVFRSQYT